MDKNYIRDFHMGYKQSSKHYGGDVSCVTLCKSNNLSVPQLLYLKIQMK